MSVNMQQVLSEIDKDEPNYAAAAKLGSEALPFLQMIIEGNDPLKAAKAVYAASLIGGSGAIEALTKAADHHDPQVRIAVAHGLRNLANAAPTELVMKSLNDHDPGVRKLALSTASLLKRAEFSQRVSAIAQSDPEEYLQKSASTIAKTLLGK
jgi:HEAT repeat protein